MRRLTAGTANIPARGGLGTGAPREGRLEDGYFGSPVLGLRSSGGLGVCLKFSMFVIGPARVSNDPPPIRCPLSQLSSINRITEDWSVTVWSTKFGLANG